MSFAFTSHTVACSITSISCAFPFYPLTLLSFSISHQKLCCAFSNFPFSFLIFFSSPTPCSFYMYTRCIYGQAVCLFSSCIRVILQEQTQSMQVLGMCSAWINVSRNSVVHTTTTSFHMLPVNAVCEAKGQDHPWRWPSESEIWTLLTNGSWRGLKWFLLTATLLSSSERKRSCSYFKFYAASFPIALSYQSV